MTTNPNMTETTELNAEIPLKLHTDVKVAAIEDGVPMKKWVAAALQFKLDQRKKEKEESRENRTNSADDSAIVEASPSGKKPASLKPRSSHVKRASKKR